MMRTFYFLSMVCFLAAVAFGYSFSSSAHDSTTPNRSDEESATEFTELDLVTFHKNSFDAYMHALKEEKYTVILFGVEMFGSEAETPFVGKMIHKLSDPSLAKYSDRAVVSVTDGDFDKGARQLEEALKVIRYPTVVVLKTNNENIHVVGRIEGEVPIEEIDRVFAEAMREPIRSAGITSEKDDASSNE